MPFGIDGRALLYRGSGAVFGATVDESSRPDNTIRPGAVGERGPSTGRTVTNRRRAPDGLAGRRSHAVTGAKIVRHC